MPLALSGVVGALRWGYHDAGSLRDWAISRDGGVSTLTATVDRIDTLRIAQRPLTFTVAHPAGVWRWPVLNISIEGASLRATLGPKEGVSE